MSKVDIGKLALELGEDVDEMLSIKENKNEVVLNKTNRKATYKLVDDVGQILEGEGKTMKSQTGNKTVAYLDPKQKTYFDAETIEGGPYSIGGRNIQTKERVIRFFQSRGWTINSK